LKKKKFVAKKPKPGPGKQPSLKNKFCEKGKISCSDNKKTIYVTPNTTSELHYEDDGSLVNDEKLKIDFDQLDRTDHLFQGDTGQGSRQYGKYCKICNEYVDSGKALEYKGARSWVHFECWICFCGKKEQVHYDENRERFLCDVPSRCSFLRECYICHLTVDYKGFFFDHFVHRECIQCRCGEFKNVSLVREKMMCTCISAMKAYYGTKFKDKYVVRKKVL